MSQCFQYNFNVIFSSSRANSNQTRFCFPSVLKKREEEKRKREEERKREEKKREEEKRKKEEGRKKEKEEERKKEEKVGLIF